MSSVAGMIVPIVTPLTESQQVDRAALARLCDIQVRAGINVIFALGTTGEFYGLTLAGRRVVVETVVEAVAGRIPVIVGISSDSTVAAITNYECCRHAGVAGYVASTPYFLSYTQDELKDHFHKLADAIGSPLILYNYPGRYRHRIDIDTVAALTAAGVVSSIKDTAGDFEYMQQLLQVKRSYPRLGVFESALQNLAQAAPLGIDGSVQAIANLCPEQCAGIWSAIGAGDFGDVARRTAALWDFHRAIEREAIFIAALKGCMAGRGWCAPTTAAPTRCAGPAQQKRLEQLLQGYLAIDKG